MFELLCAVLIITVIGLAWHIWRPILLWTAGVGIALAIVAALIAVAIYLYDLLWLGIPEGTRSNILTIGGALIGIALAWGIWIGIAEWIGPTRMRVAANWNLLIFKRSALVAIVSGFIALAALAFEQNGVSGWAFVAAKNTSILVAALSGTIAVWCIFLSFLLSVGYDAPRRE